MEGIGPEKPWQPVKPGNPDDKVLNPTTQEVWKDKMSVPDLSIFIILMKLNLKRTDDAFQLTGKSEHGHTIVSDASEMIGGNNSGIRPMEALLHSLAACSAIDMINILQKQKQGIEDFKVEVKGKRKASIPSPFESIQLDFKLKGDLNKDKVQRAMELTRDKYCSVKFSLHPDIIITYNFTIEP